MKKCSACQEEKSVSMFHKNKGTCDGLSYLCKPCKKEHAAKSYQANKQATDARNRKYYLEHKEQVHEYLREYKRLNRHKHSQGKQETRNRIEADRRARKLSATHGDIELNDLVFTEAYTVARDRFNATGIKHHVDHIVPLKSKLVCGLHCWTNIRVIPWYENISKGNTLQEDLLWQVT
jgi:hypothetical protein